jgi:hypothetical protein
MAFGVDVTTVTVLAVARTRASLTLRYSNGCYIDIKNLTKTNGGI